MSDYESPIKNSTGGVHWPGNQIPPPDIHVEKYLTLPTPTAVSSAAMCIRSAKVSRS